MMTASKEIGQVSPRDGGAAHVAAREAVAEPTAGLSRRRRRGAVATTVRGGCVDVAGLLASIDGKKKMSTMEKSRHDWGQWKETQDETTREQMAQYAKDGYLEKVAFLERTDARQAQVARSNRRRGMGLRGED